MSLLSDSICSSPFDIVTGLSEGSCVVGSLRDPSSLSLASCCLTIWFVVLFSSLMDGGCHLWSLLLLGLESTLSLSLVPSQIGSSYFLVESALKRQYWRVSWFLEEAWDHSAQGVLVCDRGQFPCPFVSKSLCLKLEDGTACFTGLL